MDKEIQQNIGSSNPKFSGFSFPQPEGPLLHLNNNLDNFASNGDYGLVDENVGNQNDEAGQEFTFPTQPSNNEFMHNDGMSSFLSSGDKSNSLTNFVSVSESLSQGSDFSNYQGNFSSSFTSAAQSMSLDNSHMYQDNLMTLTHQSISQGHNLFSQQSNLSTIFASNPQSLNQEADISYQNSFTNFASNTSQSSNQASPNPSNYLNTLSRNFNSTHQPWNHQGLNPQYPQPNLVTNNFSSLPPPLTQEYNPPYQANLTTNFSSTPQPVGQVPDLSYHQDNSSTNFFSTPQSLDQVSSLVRLNHDNPSSNFTLTPHQSLNQWPSLHPSNPNNPSFNFIFASQPLNQGSSWRHLNHDNPSTNFPFTPQQLNQVYSLPSQNHDNPSSNFTVTPQLLNQVSPSTNFTFTSQPLNQAPSALPQNPDFNNPNENLLGFPNERDDYSNYLIAQGRLQPSQNDEAARAPSVPPFSYNPTVVQQNPNNQGFNMAQPSPIMPQDNSYTSLLNSMIGAPTNNAATTTPPQPPSVDVGGLLRSGNRSAAAVLATNTQLFGKGLLGQYQALSNNLTRGFGRGSFPYSGQYRNNWRNAILESILIAASGPDRGNKAAEEVKLDEQALKVALATDSLLNLQREVGPRWTFRLPPHLVAAAGNTAPTTGGGVAAVAGAGTGTGTEAGRKKGGERRGRKKSKGITINEGGRPRETGVIINEGGRGKGKEKVGEGGVQGASRKGKEKVGEGSVQGRGRKGKEKVHPNIDEDDDDDDDDDTTDEEYDIPFHQDDDYNLAVMLNWHDFYNRIPPGQTSFQGPLPPPPPPSAN
nr:hypothetical protein Iba_chr10dCG2650 [Ipomoea batatas]